MKNLINNNYFCQVNRSSLHIYSDQLYKKYIRRRLPPANNILSGKYQNGRPGIQSIYIYVFQKNLRSQVQILPDIL